MKIIKRRKPVKLYSYDDITLRLYMEIGKTGKYSKLKIKGKPTPAQCLKAWEEIVKKNNEGSSAASEASIYTMTMEGLNKHLADYVAVKADLLILVFEIDDDRLKYLESKGYKLDQSSGSKFTESLNAALRRAENLKNKAESRKEELINMSKGKAKKEIGFDEVMAGLISMWGQPIDDNITLVRFNEYQRIIQKKIDLKKKKHVSGN